MRQKLPIIACFLLGLLPFLIRTPLTFLTDPPPWPDEAIYVDIVKTLNETGTLATNIYGPAYPGMTKAATYYPPVYFYVLAEWTRLFGYSIIAVRMLSIIVMSIVLVLLFSLFLKLSKNPWIAAAGLLILTTDLFFTRTAKIARMESLVFLFGTAAIWLYAHHVGGTHGRVPKINPVSSKTRKKPFTMDSLVSGTSIQGRNWIIFGREIGDRPHAWLVGILAALAALTHPMGLLTHIVIGLRIIFSKRSTLLTTSYQLLTFIAPTFIGALLWIVSMIPVWDIFRAQWAIQILRKTLSEPYIFFLWRTNSAFLLVSLVVLIIFGVMLLFRHTRNAAILLGISIGWALWGREMWYIAYITPFVAYAVVSLLKEEKTRGIGLLLAGALIITNLHLLQDTQSLVMSPTSPISLTPYGAYTTAIADKIPKAARVLVSAIPDPSFGLSSYLATRPYEFIHDHVTKPEIYEKHLDTMDYLVLNLFSDPILPAYAKANAEQETLVDEGGYKVLVVKLVSKNQRKHIEQ